MVQVKKIRELFFENPIKEFYLRQIARITKIPKTTVARRLKELIKQKIIIKLKSEPFDKYRANEQGLIYTFYKKFFILEKIYKSGLIEYMVEKTSPKAIILFGSCAKAEYDKDSDIDICIIANKITLNFDKFKFNHEIQTFFFSKLSEIPRNLRQNIINGIVLYGFLK